MNTTQNQKFSQKQAKTNRAKGNFIASATKLFNELPKGIILTRINLKQGQEDIINKNELDMICVSVDYI